MRLKKEKEEKEHKKKEKAEAHLYTIIKVSGSTFAGYVQVVFSFLYVYMINAIISRGIQ